MAADLKDTPAAGLDVQLCGDAHLSNFGVFASPERRLLFDLNDFDETLPGPFEYDVKRMAASFTIAGRNNGFAKADIEAATRAAVTAYREAMAEFAQMRTMDIWYAHLTDDDVMAAIRGEVAKVEKGGGKKAKSKKEVKAAKKAEKTAEKTRAKAYTRDSLQALSKLGELVDGRYRIVSQPPIVVPVLQPHFELIFCVTWVERCSLPGHEGGRPGRGGRGGSGVARGVGGGAGGARRADRAAVFPAGAAGPGVGVCEGLVVAGRDP